MQKKHAQRVYEQHHTDLHVGVNEALARIERLEQLVTPLSCGGAAPSRDSGTVAVGPGRITGPSGSVGYVPFPLSQGSYPSKELANGEKSFREEAEDRNGELGKEELKKQRELGGVMQAVRDWEKRAEEKEAGSGPAPGGAYTSEYLRGFDAAKALLSLTTPKGHIVLPEAELEDLKMKVEVSRKYGNVLQEALTASFMKNDEVKAHLDKALAELADASEREKALTSKLEQLRAKSAEWKETAMSISAGPPTKKNFPLDKIKLAYHLDMQSYGWSTYHNGAYAAWRLAHE